jgi:5,10-methylene-tetrahydrofolate dehydrogenase/methenyl tetrahydrofolate cyclohydrolase
VITGDVDFEKKCFITPVPGGVALWR